MRRIWSAILAAILAASPAAADEIATLAESFGARPAAWGMRLSPGGNRILYYSPAGSQGTAVRVADIGGSQSAIILSSDRPTVRPNGCGFKTDDRLICYVEIITMAGAERFAANKAFSISADGQSRIDLGQRRSLDDTTIDGRGAELIDWLADDPGHVLMQVALSERANQNSNVRSTGSGLSVQKVDILTGRMTLMERANPVIARWDGDDRGAVRYKALQDIGATGYRSTDTSHYVRPRGGDWRQIPVGSGSFDYLGFDPDADAYYTLRDQDGRTALFREATDGSGKQLLFAHPRVDVDGLLRIGKFRRPVAASYTVDADEYHFFDPALEKRTKALSAALPGKPPVIVYDESADGSQNLIFAGGMTDPGRYYLYDVKTRQLGALLPVRPQLEGRSFGAQTPMRYKAADGTEIPAYLTLPPGVTSARGLPAIVMPHGGPWARDSAGFDWLTQYFAALGYAVLQPNFRGSTGFGTAFSMQNGFKSWDTAIADINAGARWLLAQGADAKRLAIFGWSYGGYAALQANVVEPDLYRAAIAVAPVTDFALWKQQFVSFSNYRDVADAVGDGPHIAAGSPARHADRINVPVLIFHGTRDFNVDVGHARAMASALKSAGKPHELVIYDGLEHQLDDSAARADMLARSARWLEAAFKK